MCSDFQAYYSIVTLTKVDVLNFKKNENGIKDTKNTQNIQKTPCFR